MRAPCRAVLSLAAAVLLGFAGPARAQDAPAAASLTASAPSSAADPGWTFRVTPYIWLASVSGSIGTGGDTSGGGGGGGGGGSGNMTFDSAWKFNAAFMLAGEARNGRWGMLVDGLFLDLTDEGSVVGDRGAFAATGDCRIQGLVMQSAVTYRALDMEHLKLDPYAGLRIYVIDVDVDVEAVLGGSLSGGFDEDARDAWTDPLLGLRAVVPILDWLSVMALGDIGGFSAGSRLAWQAMLGVDFKLGEMFSLLVAYRCLDVDYSGKVDLDLAFHGPALAFSIRF